MSKHYRDDRRRFLRGLSWALATGTAGILLPQLDLIGRAMAAAPATNEYRALVCIFLYGGNDSHNMLVPYEQAEYNAYLGCRGGVYDATNNPYGLGLARDALLPITDTASKGWGLHPACSGMQQLFASGELAFLANTGSLSAPVTRTDALAGMGVPQNLYSHNDQQRQWMRGHATAQHEADGWGGLACDQLLALNSQAVSYTHLDVYKRQGSHRDHQPRFPTRTIGVQFLRTRPQPAH